MSRGLGIVFWTLTALAVGPLSCARSLPFTDLPEHVAAMATVHGDHGGGAYDDDR